MIKRKVTTIAYSTALLCLLSSIESPIKAQSYLEPFGQNRIQYRTFQWRYYETKNFKVYHYDRAGRELAKFVAEQADRDFLAIQNLLGVHSIDPLKIVLYNNYDDYKQTNLGRSGQTEVMGNDAGMIAIPTEAIPVYHTGAHADIRMQLQAGILERIIYKNIIGEKFSQTLKSAITQSMPMWIWHGYINYVVDGWHAEYNDAWRNLLMAYPNKNYFELAEINANLAGVAIWKYVSASYGEQAARELVFGLLKNVSIVKTIETYLDQKPKVFSAALLKYFNDQYSSDIAQRRTLDAEQLIDQIEVPSDGSIITSIKVSPSNKSIAYTQWKNGAFKVYIKNVGDPNLKVVYEGANINYREKPDPDYPLLQWSNNEMKLGIVYKEANQLKMRIYNAAKVRIENFIIPPNRFDRILGMTFIDNDEQVIVSAMKNSQSDLFLLTLKRSKIENITNDVWDDLQPSMAIGGFRKGILFLSNRPEPNLNVPTKLNELPNKPFNAYYYDWNTKSTVLWKLTNVDLGRVQQAIQYGMDNFAYLDDVSGLNTRYGIFFERNVDNKDSLIIRPITDYKNSIVFHQYNLPTNTAIDVVRDSMFYKVYAHKVDIKAEQALRYGVQPAKLYEPRKIYRLVDSFEKQLKMGVAESDLLFNKSVQSTSGARFTSDFKSTQTEIAPVQQNNDTISHDPIQFDLNNLKAIEKKFVENEQNKKKEADSLEALYKNDLIADSTYVKLKSAPYRLTFKPEYFSFRLDNSIWFTKYQKLNNSQTNYINPTLGGMVSINLDDLFEDYSFSGGFRLPLDFNGLSYYFQYKNYRKRLDWGVTFLRNEVLSDQVHTLMDTVNNRPIANVARPTKSTLSLMSLDMTYPFTTTKSLQMSLGARQDANAIKTRENFDFRFSDQKIYNLFSRLAYVFDNTSLLQRNIIKGIRYKFYGEYFYTLNEEPGGFFSLGVDFRSYQRLFKNVIFATRLSGAHSGGDKKILYYLGGTDNQINYVNEGMPVDQTTTYGFQSIVTNMRGYNQNARNGNTYLLANFEVRVPIILTFARYPSKSSFLNDLQLVPFVDIGNAWSGFFPKETSFDKKVTVFDNNSNVLLDLNIPTDRRFAVGYGLGLRTSILAYFLRLDVGFNTNPYATQPVIQVGFGTDF